MLKAVKLSAWRPKSWPQDTPDHYVVLAGGWSVGTIKRIVGAPQHDGKWQWITFGSNSFEEAFPTGGIAETFEDAMRQVRASFEAFLRIAGLQEREPSMWR